MQTVRTTPHARQKYVLVRVRINGKESLILWGDPHIEWHKDILDEITDAGYDIAETLGGGWLLPEPENGRTYVWGTSDRLGTAPITLVREVLRGEVIEEDPV